MHIFSSAERETKLKNEKADQIKSINAQIVHIRGEISKFEDQLKDFQHYKGFLDSIAPQEWQEEQAQKREERLKQKQIETRMFKSNSL